jgi:hypothetical protein
MFNDWYSPNSTLEFPIGGGAVYKFANPVDP